MSVSGVLGWLNIRGLSVTAQPPAEIYAGQETYLSLRLENRKRLLPSFLLQLELGQGSAHCHLLDSRAVATETMAITFEGRGWHELAQITVVSRFPINFFIRSVVLPFPVRCLVFPRPKRCEWSTAEAGRTARGGEPSRGRGQEGEVETISEYSGREPFKRIHWRLSARHETLKVKELSAVADEPLILDLNVLSRERVEDGLACCAWLVNRSIRAQRPVGMMVGKRVITPDTSRYHRLKLLSELALYGKR